MSVSIVNLTEVDVSLLHKMREEKRERETHKMRDEEWMRAEQTQLLPLFVDEEKKTRDEKREQ